MADSKITQLVALTAVVDTDLAVVVDDPSGAPVTKKITRGNLLKRPCAIYNTNAGQSISHNTWTIVNFEDVVSDPDSLVTIGADWKFTAPEAGIYLVVCHLAYDSANGWSGTEAAQIYLRKNGSGECRLDLVFPTTAVLPVYLNGTAMISLAAADYIQIYTHQMNGGSVVLYNNADYNYVHIVRVA